MPDRETFFITGFPGFIANRLLERLARKECDFILLVQSSLLGRAREEIARIAQLVGRDAAEFKFVEGDITEPKLALSGLARVEKQTSQPILSIADQRAVDLEHVAILDVSPLAGGLDEQQVGSQRATGTGVSVPVVTNSPARMGSNPCWCFSKSSR